MFKVTYICTYRHERPFWARAEWTCMSLTSVISELNTGSALEHVNVMTRCAYMTDAQKYRNNKHTCFMSGNISRVQRAMHFSYVLALYDIVSFSDILFSLKYPMLYLTWLSMSSLEKGLSWKQHNCGWLATYLSIAVWFSKCLIGWHVNLVSFPLTIETNLFQCVPYEVICRSPVTLPSG